MNMKVYAIFLLSMLMKLKILFFINLNIKIKLAFFDDKPKFQPRT